MKQYVVYILYSDKDRKLYVGQTQNLYKRLGLHFRGTVKATRNRRPPQLIHKEYFKTRQDAMRREKFLKSLWSAKFKKKLLRDFLKRENGTIDF